MDNRVDWRIEYVIKSKLGRKKMKTKERTKKHRILKER